MKIIEKHLLEKQLYENFHDESLFIKIKCCDEVVLVDILDDYKLLENLVIDNTLTQDQVVKNNMAKLTTKFNKHLGLFTVFNNLPACYKIYKCHKSLDLFLIVYGFGEAQYGRDVAFISGIWRLG